MLPRQARLDRKSLNVVLRRGQSMVFKGGSLRYLKPPTSSNIPHGRFGVVVPNVVIKTSVARHLIKRRIYALLGRSTLSGKHIWLVVLIKLDISRMRFVDLATTITTALKQIKV